MFRFKQFTIKQDKTAMKVGTDGVLIGAWTSVEGVKTILDIGTGTGLIALMLAQRSNALIDAIEIIEEAARQASENVISSPWHDRIRVSHKSFKDFSDITRIKYDLIVTNPPFFSRSLQTPIHSRSIARHDDELPKDQLFSRVPGILAEKGVFALIIPYDIYNPVIDLAKKNGLFPARILKVRPVPEKNFHRALIEFSFNNVDPLISELVIETVVRHKYTDEYSKLTSEFYL